ncbi:MAG: hypothetical protein ACETWM_08930 [Candidatus Lokiarchaeia archaeon]
MGVMSMIDKFLHTNLFLLMFDLDFDKIELAESGRIFFKIGSDFLQHSEPIPPESELPPTLSSRNKVRSISIYFFNINGKKIQPVRI